MAQDNETQGNEDVATDAIAAKRAQLVDDNAYSEDLVRFCLEMDPAESRRKLAWVNSICAIYLLIGLIGLRPPPLDIVRQAQPAEEIVPTVIEPPVSTMQQISADSNSEQVSEKPSEEGAGVAVTVDSPDISFSVPTVGNILVPSSMAQAPPAHPMAPIAPVSSVHIEQINVTGVGGSRSAPIYPRESALRGEQGTVTILIEVEENGRISDVTVKESSGFPTLDRAAVQHAQRAWFFPPGKGKRMYECPIVFQLQ